LIFFHPVDVNLKFANLLVQPVDKLLIILLLPLLFAAEDIRKRFYRLPFPFRYLVGMNIKFTGELGQRLVFTQRRPHHTSLKFR
jgi:hypothetical protein